MRRRQTRNYNNTNRNIVEDRQYSNTLSKLQQIKGKTFWIEDPVKHEQLYWYSGFQCCFNHIVGLPSKDGEYKPIFDYEMEIFKYLDKYKHIWIKKARGLGITEFFLRYMGWLALYSDEYRGSRFVVIPGTRQKTSWDLIRRMKNIFRNYLLENYKLDTLVLNGTTIEAYPSNPEAVRGYEDYRFILLDEADYFDPANQEELEPAIRGFIPKTNPWIVMVSTAHEPNSLFHKIEQFKTDEEAGYKRLQYLYERGLGKIYKEADIEAEKERPEFRREYCGEYAFGVGNLFSETNITYSERLGRELDARLMADINHTITAGATRKSLGIDIGWGSSRTAFVLTEFVDNTIRVIRCEQYDRPDFDRMVRHTYDLCRQYELDNGTNKIFVDGSAPSFIQSTKKILGEEPDYLRLVDMAKQSDSDPVYFMNVVPVNFSQRNQAMLDNAKRIVDKHSLAINPDTSQGHKDLLTDLRIAKNKPETLKLDKSDENKMDMFDSLRLALEYYK